MNPLLSYIRHLVSFLLTKAAIAVSLPEDGLSNAISYAAEGVAVFVSWLLVKYVVPFFLQVKPSGPALLLLFLGVLSFALSSCADLAKPQAYIVDTTPYKKVIEANPESVTVRPEHVVEVGGFQASFGVTALTDHGEVNLSNNGVSGDVVIDLTTGK